MVKGHNCMTSTSTMRPVYPFAAPRQVCGSVHGWIPETKHVDWSSPKWQRSAATYISNGYDMTCIYICMYIYIDHYTYIYITIYIPIYIIIYNCIYIYNVCVWVWVCVCAICVELWQTHCILKAAQHGPWWSHASCAFTAVGWTAMLGSNDRPTGRGDESIYSWFTYEWWFSI